MFFKQVEVGLMQNFSYIIGDEGEAAVVDPGWEYKKIIDICEENNLKIKKILLTHSHYDHKMDLKKLVKKSNAEVYVHELENLKNENFKIIYIKDNDKINIGKIEIKVIHTPGHSAGSVCFLFDKKLITGDTLFVGAIGRVDLPGSSEEDMMKSLKRLSQLDKDIEVYPGHDYGEKPCSTIGYEKENNPFLKN
jgi:glyoxylase-like metal-dependent hydrolase (beta-lactamase superfamily II)